MLYRFGVNLTDDEYYKFNVFMQTRSEMGKKNVWLTRIVFTVAAVIFALVLFSTGTLGVMSIPFLIQVAIVILIFQIKYIAIVKYFIRKAIESYKEQGKFIYSPESVIEFDEDKLYEITDESKIEQMLSNMEFVSICEYDKVIYISRNAAMTFVMPYRVFENDEQREEFIEFLRRKCNKVEVCLK